jgi:hypothetical protein
MCENPSKKNPFIDPQEWNKFIDFAKAMYTRMLRDEADGADQF